MKQDWNSERLRKVADAIEADEKHFAMDFFINCEEWDALWEPMVNAAQRRRKNSDKQPLNFAQTLADFDVSKTCNTTMCIGGWAVHLFGDQYVEEHGYFAVSEVAADLLGLDDYEANNLFYDFDTIESAADAAARLRRMADEADVARLGEEAPC